MKLVHVYRKDYLNSIENIQLEINKPGIYGVFAKDIGDVSVLFDVISRGFQDQGMVETGSVAYVYSGDAFYHEHAKSLKRLLSKTSFNGDKMIELCQNFGIEKDKVYKKLSAGQKNVFNICFVASMECDVYMFLNPFSHLDSKHTKKVKQLLIDLFESNKIVLVSGHHLTELETILSDIIMLKNHTVQDCFGIEQLNYMTFTHDKEGAIGMIKRLDQTKYLHHTKESHEEMDLKTFYEAYLEGTQ